MKLQMKNKERATGYFIFVVSSILIIGYIFVFIDHIDSFVNAKDGTAEIVGHKEYTKGDGIFIRLSCYNEYKFRTDFDFIAFGLLSLSMMAGISKIRKVRVVQKLSSV
jgi:hypothetical protein